MLTRTSGADLREAAHSSGCESHVGLNYAVMAKRIIWISAATVFLLAAAAAVLFLAEKDPFYRLTAWAGFGRHSVYDDKIAAAAARNGVDPLLVKAVILQ